MEKQEIYDFALKCCLIGVEFGQKNSNLDIEMLKTGFEKLFPAIMEEIEKENKKEDEN